MSDFSKKIFKFILLALFAVGLILPATSLAVLSEVGDTVVTLEVSCPGGTCVVLGCTNPEATNYSPTATSDDGTCVFSSDPERNILGCMDREATNYNPNATVDDDSCRYAEPDVPNVLNFTATKSGGGTRLSWRLPVYNKFASVVIIKGVGRIPAGLFDGEEIYNGGGTSVSDANVSPGTTYYYLAVVKGTNGKTSSGAVTSYRPESDTEPIIVVGPITDPGGRGGGSFIPGPFDQLPVGLIATDTEQQLAQIPELFVLIQPGEKIKPFFDGGYVKIKGNKPFTVSVDYYKMPEVLKTIGMTLYDINDPSQSFSFLLKLNDEKTAYEATIGPLPEDGTYGASIYLINYQDQTIKKYTGQIAVVGSLGILGVGTERFVKQVAGPVAVTGGVAAGFFQLLFASGGAGTWTEVYLLLLRQLGAILGFLGVKKKNKPWGTVYDSITKRPIDPAYVSVSIGREQVATAITDIDGRYGFSLLDGNYSLTASKTHYRFPSVQLVGRNSDEVYSDLYFGEPFHVGAGEVISKNIPLDPVDFDWNEFVKSNGKFSELFVKHEVTRAKVIRIIYDAGLTASIFYLIFYPSIFNILVPVLYLAIYLSGRYYRGRHKVVTVKNAITGEPMPFAIIRVFYAGLDQEVKKVVTDMVGRFYLLVRPGTYSLAVDHKQPDGSYARIYVSPDTELKKGVWEKDILV